VRFYVINKDLYFFFKINLLMKRDIFWLFIIIVLISVYVYSQVWIYNIRITSTNVDWGGVSFTNISNITVSQYVNAIGGLCIRGNCITSWANVSGKTVPQAIKDKDLNYLSMFFIDDLIKNGSVTINDYVTLINSVGTPDFWAMALSFATPDIAAAILNSTGISADRAASILNSTSITVDKIVHIFNSANITIDRIASILNSPNMSPDKAALILASSNIDPSKVKSILSSLNINANRVQAILYKMVDLRYYDRLLQIMTFDATDFTVSSNTILNTTGVNRYRNLIINSRATLTVGREPGVIIADTINNYGSIVSGWVKGAGGIGSSGGYNGGNGTGGIIILARNIVVGNISADGKAAPNVKGTSSGPTAGGSGAFWLIGSDMPGKGGEGELAAIGTPFGCFAGSGGYNGGGGGGVFDGQNCYPGADGGDSSRTYFSTAIDLLNELFKSVVDWYIVNVLGKNPSTIKSIPSLGGSGGGGGNGAGGGGGGGGQIIIYGTSITTGTITARGGSGGAHGEAGGGGGGGGVVYIFYRSLIGKDFIIDVSGGVRGLNAGSGLPGVSNTILIP